MGSRSHDFDDELKISFLISSSDARAKCKKKQKQPTTGEHLFLAEILLGSISPETVYPGLLQQTQGAEPMLA